MAVIYTPHFVQFFDDTGAPLAGGKLYTYAAGTSTPKATYTDASGSTPNANPVVLDAAGRATVFLTGSYKFTLKTSGDVLVKETDNVTAFTSSGSSVDSITTSFTEDVITASDSIIFSDASDSGNTKRDTVQGLLDLVGTGALVYLGSATASASATLDFTSLLNSTNYTAYIFVFNNILPATSGSGMLARTSSNNGSSWDNSAGNYSYTAANLYSTYSGTGNNSHTDMQVTSLLGIDTTVSNNSLNGIGYLFVGASKYTYLNCRTHYLSSGNALRTIDTTSCRLSTTEVNAIRFLMDSGNIASGTIRLYGVKKS